MALFPYLVLVLVAHAVAYLDIDRRQSLVDECSNLTELELLDRVRKENLHILALWLGAGQLTRLEDLGEVTKLQAPVSNKLEHVRLVVKAPVTELDLHENRLDTQDISEMLRGMWRLQLLDISQNLVKELPVFRPRFSGQAHLLPNLRFLNLSRNRLEHLDQDSPLLSPTVTHLDVSYNRIRGIGAHTLGMVENLQYLFLQGNFIVQVL